MKRTITQWIVLAAAVAAPVLISACGGNDTPAPAPTPLPSTLQVGNNLPEDIAVSGTTAYVSSLGDGSILKLDLAQPEVSSTFAPAATDDYRSGWGLRVVEAKNWLLAVQNIPYDFNPANAKAGRLVAFDLATGTKLKSWNLPAQAVGNSVDVDAKGNIYVGDIGPNPRLIKIDPNSDQVSVWATGSNWVSGGFGVGGMVSANGGFYAAHNDALWYVGIAADGTATAPLQVEIEGNPKIFADGMLWYDGGIEYAENDAFVAGDKGSVFRVNLTSPTRGSRTMLKEGLTDPSGISSAMVNGRHYLLVNESQLGHVIGVDPTPPKTPFQVKVFAR
jgi:hypothetical protein